MPKFIVGVREVHVSSMEVEADDKEHATKRVQNGHGNELMCEYSHTLDPGWTDL